MTINSYLPYDVYVFLLQLAHEHDLSLKEVELVLLRKVMKDFGFKCKHKNIGIAKTTGLPFCKGCYQRMQMIRAPRYNHNRVMVKEGIYEELPTFLDEIERLR